MILTLRRSSTSIAVATNFNAHDHLQLSDRHWL
jgi:hypothetical protein